MTKKLPFTRIIILATFALMILTQCSKSFNGSSKENNTDLSSKSIPNVLPGSCPYPCNDIRCKGYSHGYCGPTPVNYKQIAISNTNITNIMTSAFSVLNVDFVELSKELGLTDTLKASDIDFVNLTESYDASDSSGKAIVSTPFP